METQVRRTANEGPFIDQKDIAAFLKYCAKHTIPTRQHSGWPNQKGYQVSYRGHWMALCWNKSFKRYTVDKRLSELHTKFISGILPVTA